MEEYVNKKRVRDVLDESGLDSPEVKKLRHDLLDVLDESDPDPAVQDLASVMKSFEEEISGSPSPVAVPLVDLTSDSGKSRPELGYLLEASDDELGLPPSSTTESVEEVKVGETELEKVSTESTCLDELWSFDGGIPSYDSFEFLNGEGYTSSSNNHVGGGGEYVALEGLFDYSDVRFESSEVSDYSWRFETQPTL